MNKNLGRLASMDYRVKRCGCFIRNLDDRYYVVFRCADPETYDYYYFVDRQTRNNSLDCPPSKKFSCLQLKGSFLG